jgi:pimeloyl-ACP methyl ester carboxylesterase
VCGLSLGGYVALSLALRRPEAVSALILANTRAEADGEEGRAGRDGAIATIRSRGTAPFLDGLLARVLSPDAPDDVRARARVIADRQPGDAVVAALAALRDRPDRVADLGRIRVPTLVIAGADDGLIPAAAAETLADGIPGARLQVIPGAGHLSALERPEEFATAVTSFLRAP